MGDDVRQADDSWMKDEERIQPLVDLEVDPDPGFVLRIHRSIDRRLLAGNILRVALVLPIETLLEFLKVISFDSGRTARGPGEADRWRHDSR